MFVIWKIQISRFIFVLGSRWDNLKILEADQMKKTDLTYTNNPLYEKNYNPPDQDVLPVHTAGIADTLHSCPDVLFDIF